MVEDRAQLPRMSINSLLSGTRARHAYEKDEANSFVRTDGTWTT